MQTLKLIPLITSLAVLGVSAQECIMKEHIVSKEIGVIADIRNIQAEVTPFGKNQQKCTVTLEGFTSNKWYPARGEFIWDGDYTPAKACSAAVDLAKKNLLTGLNSSTIANTSVVICKEPEEKDRPILNPKVGTILDDLKRLRLNPAKPTFYHKGEECKWYLETAWNGKDIKQFNGIVCRYGPDKWIIVDKF